MIVYFLLFITFAWPVFLITTLVVTKIGERRENLLLKSLDEIAEFGALNPGRGYSCRRKAVEAINKFKEKYRND